MKLKEWYEKLYDKVFSIGFFRAFLKIPGLKKLLEYEMISYLFFGVMTTVVNFIVTAFCNWLAGDGYSEKILFNAVHVHTGVHFYRGNRKLRDEYCDYLVSQIVKSIKEAWSSRAPGQIAYGYDLVVTAFNRRIVYFNERKGAIGSAPRGKAALQLACGTNPCWIPSLWKRKGT